MRTHGWSGARPATDDEAIERILDAASEAIEERKLDAGARGAAGVDGEGLQDSQRELREVVQVGVGETPFGPVDVQPGQDAVTEFDADVLRPCSPPKSPTRGRPGFELTFSVSCPVE